MTRIRGMLIRGGSLWRDVYHRPHTVRVHQQSDRQRRSAGQTVGQTDIPRHTGRTCRHLVRQIHGAHSHGLVGYRANGVERGSSGGGERAGAAHNIGCKYIAPTNRVHDIVK